MKDHVGLNQSTEVDQDIHPFPWRRGDTSKGEQPWFVFDADGGVVAICAHDDPGHTPDLATEWAARIVYAANR